MKNSCLMTKFYTIIVCLEFILFLQHGRNTFWDCSVQIFSKFDLLGKIVVVTQYNIAQHNIMHLGNKVYNFSLVFSQFFDEYFM